MRAVHFLTHPEVLIDPAVPVPDWGLSPLGLRRSRLAAERRWPDTTRAVFHSGERKARETAQPIAARLGLVPVTLEALGENDRSATGYLPKAEFETVGDDRFLSFQTRLYRGRYGCRGDFLSHRQRPHDSFPDRCPVIPGHSPGTPG